MRLVADTLCGWWRTLGAAGGGHLVRLEADTCCVWRLTLGAAGGGHLVRLEADTWCGWRLTLCVAGGGPTVKRMEAVNRSVERIQPFRLNMTGTETSLLQLC